MAQSQPPDRARGESAEFGAAMPAAQTQGVSESPATANAPHRPATGVDDEPAADRAAVADRSFSWLLDQLDAELCLPPQRRDGADAAEAPPFSWTALMPRAALAVAAIALGLAALDVSLRIGGYRPAIAGQSAVQDGPRRGVPCPPAQVFDPMRKECPDDVVPKR